MPIRGREGLREVSGRASEQRNEINFSSLQLHYAHMPRQTLSKSGSCLTSGITNQPRYVDNKIVGGSSARTPAE